MVLEQIVPQKYQTKFTHIFLEAFLRKTTKKPTIKIFTKLYKIKTFFVASVQNQKAMHKKQKKANSIFTLICYGTRDTS